ncbi:zinc finger and SCAN domain-containing protein 22-like [Bradysia coprophila]|uniref:zinc finger and SCAN domain-containing protein 22-like n=1 Tax=Bradysia coprophila TaxID=38358 RepID=UPI00187DC59D|nr:zinc finger and SCAN domain-containing protein 22-like [Bradysia coprophila]
MILILHERHAKHKRNKQAVSKIAKQFNQTMSKAKLQCDRKKNISPQKDLQDNTLRRMENLLSSCRLCLTSLNDGQSIDLFDDENVERPYSLVAEDLTSLQITKDDMYPNNICESCASQLAIFDSFRTSCQLSFKKLQAIVPLGMSIRDSRKQKLTAEYIFEADGNEMTIGSEGSVNDDEILVQLCDYEPVDTNESQDSGPNETDNLIELTIKTEEVDAEDYANEPLYLADQVNIQNVAIKDESKPKRKRIPKLPASERNLHCETCNITFNRGHDFTRHQMSHAGIKEFSCELCHQQFTRRSHLNSHMMIHNQIKPFSCDTCGFMFRKLSNLHRHMSVHSDIYNFECTMCDKKFKRMPSLRLHQKIHEGGCTLTCTFCGKVYASYSGFKKHLAKHNSKENIEGKTMNDDVEILYEEYLISDDVEAIET